jgi:hypothetical protein
MMMANGVAGRALRSRPSRLFLGLLVGLLWCGAGASPVAAAPAEPSEDEGAQEREVYVPHPEFHPYYDRDQLSVERVTLIRVQRADQTEAVVAREETGWEHVVLDGFRLAFYNQGRQALRPMPGRHVLVQEWSGGAHCCFDYHVLAVQGVQVRREGTIRSGDCSLRVADLDHDGSLELIGCDARFAYAFDLPFADSPMLPLVYTFRDKAYVADSRRFPQVYRYRVVQERRRFAEAQQAGDERRARRAAISVLLHLLYAGQVTEAWCAFERTYRWADRATVRREVVEALKRPPDPEDARHPFVDLSYTLAAPGRCR